MDIVVIIVYIPTTDYEDEDVEEVYEKVEDAIGKGTGDDYVTVVGDLNAVAYGKAGKAWHITTD